MPVRSFRSEGTAIPVLHPLQAILSTPAASGDDECAASPVPAVTSVLRIASEKR